MKENAVQANSLKPGRLLALDILRGLTISTLIIVNDPGIEDRVYAPLLHAKWHGITPTDFVFPSFIFIVGVSVALSFAKQLAAGVPKKQMAKKIFTRSITLYVLGVFLSILPSFNLSLLRYTGVLQRIAIVFTCCAFLYMYASWQFQVWLATFILVGYWIVMTTVPVPGYGYAILEPGKNLAAWLDSIVLPGRMWQGTWDPEGVLSTFPAIVTGILGMLVGRLVSLKISIEHKIIWLFLAGFSSFAISNGWNWFFPINKNLWTSSFVLYTAGLSAMLLASLYFVVDVLGYKRWAKFFIIYGSNAIAAYISAEFFYDILFFKWAHGATLNERIIHSALSTGIQPEIISLIWALLYCLLCFIPIYILYKKKIFLKV